MSFQLLRRNETRLALRLEPSGEAVEALSTILPGGAPPSHPVVHIICPMFYQTRLLFLLICVFVSIIV